MKIRLIEKSDIDSCLELFESCFNTKMPKELWEWKYGSEGGSGYVAVDEENKVVAHYGGVPRKMSVCGATVECVQITDSMVLMSKRGLMTKKGVFALTAEAFLDNFSGSGKRFAISFGFPMKRAEKLGEKLGLYKKADSINEIFWKTKRAKNIFYRVKELGPEKIADVQKAWDKMKKAYDGYVIGYRDVSYLKHRYIEHPTNRYKVLGMFSIFGKTPIAVAVIKEHNDDGKVEIMDLVGSPKSFTPLTKLVLDYVAKIGVKHLFAWVTPTIEKSLPKPDGKTWVCNIAMPQKHLIFEHEALQDRWIMMGGDTDFR